MDYLLEKLGEIKKLPTFITLKEYISVIKECISHEEVIKTFLSNETKNFIYPSKHSEPNIDCSYDGGIILLNLNLSARSLREAFFYPFYLGNRLISIYFEYPEYRIKIFIYGEVLPQYLREEFTPTPCFITKNLEDCSGEELLYLLEQSSDKLSVCQEIYNREEYFHKNGKYKNRWMESFVYSLYFFREHLNAFPNFTGEERTITFLSIPKDKYRGNFSCSHVDLIHVKGNECVVEINHDEYATSYEVRIIQHFS